MSLRAHVCAWRGDDLEISFLPQRGFPSTMETVSIVKDLEENLK